MNMKAVVLLGSFFCVNNVMSESAKDNGTASLNEQESAIYQKVVKLQKDGRLTSVSVNALLHKYGISSKKLYRILYAEKQVCNDEINKKFKSNLFYGAVSL